MEDAHIIFLLLKVVIVLLSLLFFLCEVVTRGDHENSETWFEMDKVPYFTSTQTTRDMLFIKCRENSVVEAFCKP